MRDEGAHQALATLCAATGAYALFGLFAFFFTPDKVLWFDRWAYIGDLTSTFVNRNSFATFAGLGLFVVYATWAAFQNAHYTHGPYLSPFYSPELWGASPHAWFGPQPGWWPGWLPFSSALLILCTNLMHDILWYLHKVVPNYGICIILLTVLVRGVMFPLSRRQALASARMQAKMEELKPEVKKLEEKHRNDSMALQQAKQELYLKRGINPLAMMGSCWLSRSRPAASAGSRIRRCGACFARMSWHMCSATNATSCACAPTFAANASIWWPRGRWIRPRCC